MFFLSLVLTVWTHLVLCFLNSKMFYDRKRFPVSFNRQTVIKGYSVWPPLGNSESKLLQCNSESYTCVCFTLGLNWICFSRSHPRAPEQSSLCHRLCRQALGWSRGRTSASFASHTLQSHAPLPGPFHGVSYIFGVFTLTHLYTEAAWTDTALTPSQNPTTPSNTVQGDKHHSVSVSRYFSGFSSSVQ